MIEKWIILDEINLKLITNDTGTTLLFDYQKDAVSYAHKYVDNSWQIINIPFGE